MFRVIPLSAEEADITDTRTLRELHAITIFVEEHVSCKRVTLYHCWFLYTGRP